MALDGLQNGRYRCIRLLGSGGMGEVYLMEDTRINRRVAIKVVRSEASSFLDSEATRDAARLFQREARAIAALEHPNILPLYDFGEEPYQNVILTYMVMPYCPDGSLTDWLRRRNSFAPLSPQDIAQLIMQAADTLQYAHDHHIIHLDVKPSNFLIRSNPRDPNRPTLLLADFGVAKLSATTSNTSRSIRGTPSAMAPEQWEGMPVVASDQYALAVMAYELLTGRPPFVGSLEQLMYQHLQVPPPVPTTINPRLPVALNAVLLRALAKSPEDRFPSIADFARALQIAAEPVPTHYGSSVPPTIAAKDTTRAVNERDVPVTVAGTELIPPPPPPPLPPPPAPFSLRRILLLATLALLIIGGSCAAFFIIRNGQIATDNAHATATASAQLTATAQAAASTVIAITQAQATADAIGINNPYGGKLLLDDPLRDNSNGNGWDENASSDGSYCKFSGGAYYAYQATPGYIRPCFAQNTNFSNFTYEVRMTILKGGCGGLIFRADSADSKYYVFDVCQDGTFSLFYFSGFNQKGTWVVRPQSSSAIKTGLNQINLLTVVAYHAYIYLYVNRQLATSVNDTTYDHGQIGVDADPYNTTSPVEVVFSNMRLWTW